MATTTIITMSDIAARAGVSRATVSFVLSGSRTNVRISDATTQRVLAAASELNYFPNSSAKATRSGKTGCVALLLSEEGNKSFFPFALLSGIQAGLAEHDLHLALATPPDSKLADTGYVPKMLREWMADGMLINYLLGIPDGLVKMIHQHSIPSVWINVRQEADCVYPDDLDAGFRAAQHLLSLGHKRIAYVDYNFGSAMDPGLVHYSTRDREEGYRQAMQAAGLAPCIIRDETTLGIGGYVSYTLPWLSASDRPTAVIAYTPEVANAVLYAATSHLRLRVPEDLSLITFGDRRLDSLGLPITTMKLPEYSLGLESVRTLIKKMEDPKRSLPPTALTLGFDPGASCAAPP